MIRSLRFIFDFFRRILQIQDHFDNSIFNVLPYTVLVKKCVNKPAELNLSFEVDSPGGRFACD